MKCTCTCRRMYTCTTKQETVILNSTRTELLLCIWKLEYIESTVYKDTLTLYTEGTLLKGMLDRAKCQGPSPVETIYTCKSSFTTHAVVGLHEVLFTKGITRYQYTEHYPPQTTSSLHPPVLSCDANGDFLCIYTHTYSM